MIDDSYFDPATGIYLNPSFHGEECLGSGDFPGYEICCDECDFYLVCFPDWDSPDFGNNPENPCVILPIDI